MCHVIASIYTQQYHVLVYLSLILWSGPVPQVVKLPAGTAGTAYRQDRNQVASVQLEVEAAATALCLLLLR